MDHLVQRNFRMTKYPSQTAPAGMRFREQQVKACTAIYDSKCYPNNTPPILIFLFHHMQHFVLKIANKFVLC